MSTEALRPGDEVRVFTIGGVTLGEPEGGWPGEVYVVLRLAVWIRYAGIIEAFRADSRASNDAYGRQWFRTPAEGYSPELIKQDRQLRAASIPTPAEISYRRNLTDAGIDIEVF